MEAIIPNTTPPVETVDDAIAVVAAFLDAHDKVSEADIAFNQANAALFAAYNSASNKEARAVLELATSASKAGLSHVVEAIRAKLANIHTRRSRAFVMKLFKQMPEHIPGHDAAYRIINTINGSAAAERTSKEISGALVGLSLSSNALSGPSNGNTARIVDAHIYNYGDNDPANDCVVFTVDHNGSEVELTVFAQEEMRDRSNQITLHLPSGGSERRE